MIAGMTFAKAAENTNIPIRELVITADGHLASIGKHYKKR